MVSLQKLSAEALSLRDFLGSRCGNLRAAFNMLAGHDVGHVTSDGFAKGLERLGYTGNTVVIFRELDITNSGLVSLRTFMETIGGFSAAGAGDEATEFRAQCFRKSGSESQLLKPPVKPPVLRKTSCDPPSQKRIDRERLEQSAPDQLWASGRRSLTPPLLNHIEIDSPFSGDRGSAMPAEPTTRLVCLQDQINAQRTSQDELEQRLRRQIDELFGASLAAQLDALRQQLTEERAQRDIDIAALRASLDAVAFEAKQSCSDAEALALREATNIEERLRTHIGAFSQTVGKAEVMYSGSLHFEELQAKFRDFSAECTSRLDALDTFCAKRCPSGDAEQQQALPQVDEPIGVGSAACIDTLPQQLAEVRRRSEAEVSSISTRVEAIAIQVGDLQEHLDIAGNTQRLEAVQSRLEAFISDCTCQLDAMSTFHAAAPVPSEKEGAEDGLAAKVDILHHQLVAEREHRELDISAVRRHLESISAETKAVEENVQAKLEESLIQTHMAPRSTISSGSDASGSHDSIKNLHSRVEKLAIETAARCDAAEITKEQMRPLWQLEGKLEVLREEWQAMRYLLKEELLGMRRDGGDTADLDKFVSGKLRAVCDEFNVALEDERTRSHERIQVLGRSVRAELEHSVVSQAVAKARDEAQLVVGRRLREFRRRVDAEADAEVEAEADLNRSARQPVVRSQSSDEFRPRSERILGTNFDSTLNALREENLTLREANVEIREVLRGHGKGSNEAFQAAASGGETDATGAFASAAIPATGPMLQRAQAPAVPDAVVMQQQQQQQQQQPPTLASPMRQRRSTAAAAAAMPSAAICFQTARTVLPTALPSGSAKPVEQSSSTSFRKVMLLGGNVAQGHSPALQYRASGGFSGGA